MATKVDILERFGKRVRKLRSDLGYSQESFALEVGVDRTYMGGIERGERNVALRNLLKIADALGISLAELMRGL
ncbi:MAG: helix-turn-helix transcriptional regulator [Cyanobacteria bacterium P01_E01_bin.34]